MGCNPATAEGVLVIAGETGDVSLHLSAWTLLTVAELWPAQAARRGASSLLPHAPGRTPWRRRVDETAYSLPMLIAGDVDVNGDPVADPWEGLEANVAYLHDELVVDPGTDAGTRAAELTMPSGTILVADVHVLAVTRGRPLEGVNHLDGVRTVVTRATFDMSIPGGEFALAGS